ncbi:GspH/FimT family pseudopilin [Marinobacter sp. BW6]|uniref:GspH/FimT family pseudopilin n=1 Tax=Marinobacter sp. BW6 TaxID=2592624 RepID=UPI001396849E|nr:GspH/FimT family pseudopilin [Marinobacter sp. BW6]
MNNYSKSGFTLVELSVVLAISAIILAFAIPGTANLLNHSGRHTALSDLIATLNLARNTAINEQTTVTLCAIGNDSKCANDWSLPIVAFRDPTRSKQIKHDSQIVRVMHPIETGRLVVRSGIHNYFRFQSSGWSRGTLGHFIWCPDSDDNHYAAQVRINMGGRPQMARDYDGDGVVEDASGDPVTCEGI